MTSITAAEVKKLRDATGAGMMAAKKALEEAGGDQDKAAEVLRIKGETKVKERGAERSATNGLVAAADGAMIQLNCETDFVAKNEQFNAFGKGLCMTIAASSPPVQFLTREHVDPALVAKEREIVLAQTLQTIDRKSVV